MRSPVTYVATLAMLAIGVGMVSASAPETVIDSTVEELIQVDRVRLPVSITGPDCAELLPTDVSVREDGRPVPRVVAVERPPRATVHALLLDTSVSMLQDKHIEFAKDASRRYIRDLEPGERLLLASFNNDLRIRYPLTTIRTVSDVEHAIRVLDEIDVEGWTSLHDSLLSLTAYLAGRAERSALVVLSDGVDTVSAIPGGRLERFVESSSAESNLSLFAVGLGMGRAEPVWKNLRSMSRATGGRAFLIDDASALERTFAKIRELVHGEVVVDYESWPAGAGPRDRGGDRPVTRGVSVGIRRGLDCHVANHRQQRAVGETAAAGIEDGLEGPLRWPPAVAPPPGPVRALQAAETWSAMNEGRVERSDVAPHIVSLDPHTIAGAFSDLRADAGPRYVESKRGVSELKSEVADFAPLAFHVTVPSFERLLERIDGPEDAALELLRLGRKFDQSAGVNADASALVSGESFVWLREPIAENLLRHHRGYSGWAARKIEIEARRAVEGVISSELGRLEVSGLRRLDERRNRLVLELRSGLDGPRAAKLAARWRAAQPELPAQAREGAASEGAISDGFGRGLAERLRRGTDEDEASYLAELLLNVERTERLRGRGSSAEVERQLSQLEALRYWMLRQQLSQAGPTNAARYLAEWLPDLSPLNLALRMERELANRILVFGRGPSPEERQRLARGWESLWSRLGRPSGLRSFTILHPAYRHDLDRIGFYRVTLPAARPRSQLKSPPSKVSRNDSPSSTLRELFPRTPWALRLVELLAETEALASLGATVRIEWVAHRQLDAEGVVADLLRPLRARITELDDDWELQKEADFAEGPARERAVRRLIDRRSERRALRRQARYAERRLREMVDGDFAKASIELASRPGDPPGPPIFVRAYFPLRDTQPGFSGTVATPCVEVVTAMGERPPAAVEEALLAHGVESCGFLPVLRGEQ